MATELFSSLPRLDTTILHDFVTLRENRPKATPHTTGFVGTLKDPALPNGQAKVCVQHIFPDRFGFFARPAVHCHINYMLENQGKPWIPKMFG